MLLWQNCSESHFSILCSKGLLREELFPGEYVHLIDMYICLQIYWAASLKI